MKRIILSVILLLFPILLLGEWSTDSSINSIIAGENCNQEYAHITVDNNGFYYISRYQNEPEPQWYSMHMNRLDYNGNHTWGNDGILVSNHNFDSWFSDHTLTTDPDNNAILTFADLRNGTQYRDINAYLIAPDSTFLWGADGVQLSSNLHNEYSPKAIVTEAGNYVFSWIRDYDYDDSLKSSVVMQKLLPNGQGAWAQEVELFGPDTTYWKPYLVPCDNDNFINVWMRIYKTGSGYGVEYHSYIYAQKFDADGNPVWPSIVPVCDLDSLAPAVAFYQEPEIISDGNNGVFVSWYDCRIDHFTHQTYVQHILSDGTVDWQTNGVQVAIYDDHSQVSPSLCYYESEQKLYVIWNDYYFDNATSSYRYGISGQLLSDSGNMLWNDNGVVLQPYSILASNGYSIPQAHITTNGDAVIVYQKDSLTVVPAKADTIFSTYIKATRVDQTGNFVWDDEQVWLCDLPSWKLSTFSSEFMNDQVVAIWTDNRSGTEYTWPGDLYAQNVRGDGSLGPATSINEPPQESPLFSFFPNPVQDKIHINYTIRQQGAIEITLYNIKGQRVFYNREENIVAGEYNKIISSAKMKTGVYVIKVKNGSYREVRKIVIFK